MPSLFLVQDSIFVKFKMQDEKDALNVAAHMELAEKIAGEISATYKHPNELEFEKVKNKLDYKGKCEPC